MIQDAISLLKFHGIEVKERKPNDFHVSGIVGIDFEKNTTSSLDPEILQSLNWPNLPCLKDINWSNLGNPSVEFIYPLIDFNETKEKIEENLGLILDLNNSIYFNDEEVGRWTWSRKLIDLEKNDIIEIAKRVKEWFKVSDDDEQGMSAIGDIMESNSIQRDLDLLRFIGITVNNSKLVNGTFTISGGLFCLEIDDSDYIKLENRERFARKYLVLEKVISGKLYLVYPTKWYDEVRRHLSSKNIHFFSLNSVYDTGEKIGKVIRNWQSIGVKQSEILGMAKRIRKNLGVSGDDEQGMISTSLLLESNKVPNFSKWTNINEDAGGPVSFLRGLGIKVDVKDYLGWESDYKVYYDFPVLYIKNIELKETDKYVIQKKWINNFAEICNKPKWISKDSAIGGEEWQKFVYLSHEDIKSDLERWVKLSNVVKAWGRFQTGEPLVRDYVTNDVIIKIEMENPGKFQKNGIAKLAERLSSGMADDEKSGVTNAGDLLENNVPTFNQWTKDGLI